MEVQNFEFPFFLRGGGGGGGREGQKNKYVWGYNEIMIFLTFWGVISINLGIFKGQGTDFENVFGVAKFQIFWGYA